MENSCNYFFQIVTASYVLYIYQAIYIHNLISVSCVYIYIYIYIYVYVYVCVCVCVYICMHTHTYMCVCLVAQSYPALWDPMDCSRPNPSDNVIPQVRIQEYSFPSPGDLHNPGIKPRSHALQVDSLLVEPPGKPPPPHTHTYMCVCVCIYSPNRWKEKTFDFHAKIFPKQHLGLGFQNIVRDLDQGCIPPICILKEYQIFSKDTEKFLISFWRITMCNILYLVHYKNIFLNFFLSFTKSAFEFQICHNSLCNFKRPWPIYLNCFLICRMVNIKISAIPEYICEYKNRYLFWNIFEHYICYTYIQYF